MSRTVKVIAAIVVVWIAWYGLFHRGGDDGAALTRIVDAGQYIDTTAVPLVAYAGADSGVTWEEHLRAAGEPLALTVVVPCDSTLYVYVPGRDTVEWTGSDSQPEARATPTVSMAGLTGDNGLIAGLTGLGEELDGLPSRTRMVALGVAAGGALVSYYLSRRHGTRVSGCTSLRDSLEAPEHYRRIALRFVADEERRNGQPVSAPQTDTSTDRYLAEVAAEFAHLDSEATDLGFERSHRVAVSALDEGNGKEYRLYLDDEHEYLFVGECDEDCTDLDLVLSRDGEVVGSDTLPDRYPIVQYRPPEPGYYRVRVVMAACGNPPCRYGVGVYSR